MASCLHAMLPSLPAVAIASDDKAMEEEVDEAFAHLIQNEQLIEFVFGKFTINDVR